MNRYETEHPSRRLSGSNHQALSVGTEGQKSYSRGDYEDRHDEIRKMTFRKNDSIYALSLVKT